jgi:hypothetical protein
MHFLRMNSAKYAPKSDVRTVVIIVLIAVSTLHYLYQLQHVKQSLKALKSRPQYQERVKAIMSELADAPKSKKFSGAHRMDAGSTKRGGAEKTKGTDFEERKKIAEQTIEAEIGDAMPRAPLLQDTLAFAIFTAPLTCSTGFVWNVSWFFKFKLLGQEYGDAERQYLTRKAVGISAAGWEATEAAERDELVARELWLPEQLAAYEEENAGPRGNKSAKEKRAARQKKKNIEPVMLE